MALSQHTLDFIHRVIAVASQVNGVMEAVTHSKVTQVAEALVPGLATIVADINMVEGGVETVVALEPYAENLNKIAATLASIAGLKPADWNDPVRLSQDEMHKTEG